MRYAIFADIHSNLEALEAVIYAYQNESIDKYLCAGDVVGYAADPRECIEKLKECTNIVVAGNHDWASVDLFAADYFNPLAQEAIFWTRRNLDERSRCFLESLKLIYKNEDLTLVHGTLDNPQDFNYMLDTHIAEDTFRIMETNICFVGHTHLPGVFIQDSQGIVYYRQDSSLRLGDKNKYIVNVGSVGQPRDRNPRAAYCIYDTAKNQIQIKRINYDIKITTKKIINAGLPVALADRLSSGI